MSKRLLSILPSPPPDKRGWPWAKDAEPLSPVMQNGNAWPKISIVTPSYNQGQFLEETIRSVLLQNYPNLEYILMDGGSTDTSVGIIRKYEPWLTYWITGKDAGQADAVCRGFEIASGDILAWINADDFYLPDAFKIVSGAFVRKPDIEFLIGGYKWISASGKDICKYYSFPQDFDSLLCAGQLFGQMACFWKRSVFWETGALDRSLQFCFDYDFFLRLAKRQRPSGVSRILAASRKHDAAKSSKIWDSIGSKEKAEIQTRHGLDAVNDNDCIRICEHSRQTLRRLHFRGLLGDMVHDPPFFAKTIASRLRDIIVPSGKAKS